MSSVIDRAQRQSTRGSLRAPRTVEPDQMRTLLTVAFRPAGVTIVLVSVLVVVTLMAANSDLTGTFGAIAAIWMGIHQVPVTIDDTTLGVLPILPTVVMIWAAAKGCSGAVDADSERSWILRVAGAALAGPFLITLTGLAVIEDASVVIPLSTPNVLAAVAWTLGVHAIAAAIGLGVALWSTLRTSAPSWVLGAIRPAVRALAALLGAGALAVLVSMVFAWSTTGELLERGDGFVGMLGLTLLSILYLPNVVIGAVAALTGATASIGDVSVSVFGDVGGSLPPLPVLAAVPDGPAGGVWPVLLVVPFVVGVLLGRDCGRKVAGQEALFTVLAAAGGVGVAAALAGVVAGGDLGTFGAVNLQWWAFGLLTFAWLALAGSVTAVAVAWVRSRREPAAEDKGTDGSEEASEVAAVPAVAAPEAIESGAAKAAGSEETSDANVAAEKSNSEKSNSEKSNSEKSNSEKPTEKASSTRVIEAEIVEDEESVESVSSVPEEEPEAAATDVVDVEVEEDATGDHIAEDGEGDLPTGSPTPND